MEDIRKTSDIETRASSPCRALSPGFPRRSNVPLGISLLFVTSSFNAARKGRERERILFHNGTASIEITIRWRSASSQNTLGYILSTLAYYAPAIHYFIHILKYFIVPLDCIEEFSAGLASHQLGQAATGTILFGLESNGNSQLQKDLSTCQ